MAEQALVESLAEKVMESIERTEHLVSLVPSNLMEWSPVVPCDMPKVSDFGYLLGHLLDCLAGFCAALHRAFPVELADFLEFRTMTVHKVGSPSEGLARLQLYEAHIQRGFQCCTDGALSRKIPTIFVPEGQTLLVILLGNLEHLLNHKYQLFFYLKLAGVPVGSADIYKWRSISGTGD